MSQDLKGLIEEKASNIKEFWFDVDGVMTIPGPVAIYELMDDGGNFAGYKRVGGLMDSILVPLKIDGQSIPNKIETFATGDHVIAEGYRFDTRDGKVIEYLVENGFPVYFISGRNSPAVRKRAGALGATPVLGEKDKLKKIKELSKCNLEEIMFVGDGIQDVETLGAVGLSIAPADSCKEALSAAKVVTKAKGGNGVLGEVLQIFLKARGMWPG
jgi:3-deoxy-D-manno-octulosonate 8-phosphate phosphatase (KDO 8-P phosphatase)